MVAILIILGFGAITGLIADGYNRSVLGWFFLGAIFGIFAIIVLLIMGKNKTVAKHSSFKLT